MAKIGQLELPVKLASSLLIPLPVADEILAGPPTDPARLALESGWGVKVPAGEVPPFLHEWGLGKGETSVLAVALKRTTAVAVLDDAQARRCAHLYGIPVMGTLGMLLRAKKVGLLPSLTDVLVALRREGFWVDDDLTQKIMKAAGEIDL